MTSDDYLRSVGSALGDLPWQQRQDLLAELRGHLADFPADTDLAERLGTPEEYAADLRAAEGLERRHGPVSWLKARRPRNVILVTGLTVVLLTALGLGIGAVVWIDSYQPLAFGNAYQPPLGTHFGFGGDSADVHPGRPFIFGMEIVNTRRFGVRVLGAPLETDLPWTAHLFMSLPNYTGATRAPVPFQPIDLKPGERMFLAFRGVWTCPSGRVSPGVTSELHDFPVRFSFLWRTTTAEIPLPKPLEIVFPKGCR